MEYEKYSYCKKANNNNKKINKLNIFLYKTNTNDKRGLKYPIENDRKFSSIFTRWKLTVLSKMC